MLCIISCAMSGNSELSTAVLLLTIIFSSLACCIGRKKYSLLLLSVSPFLTVLFPQFICGMPIIAYDLFERKKQMFLIPYALCLFRISEISAFSLILSAVSSLTAVLLYFRTSELEKITFLYHRTRDSETEKNLMLREKNRQLSLNQDYEIHLATLKERNRIAREIHDNVGHMLTRSLLQVGALCVVNKDENQKPLLEGLRETLDSAMTSIRKSVHDLHDDSIDMKVSVQECIKSAEEKFKVHFEYDISENISKELKLCIIGVAKESISNIIKHSSGDEICIVIREHPAFYQLTVTDNGSCEHISQSGIGLSNMRDRAESAGGIISFTPSAEGFKVFMTLPKKEK